LASKKISDILYRGRYVLFVIVVFFLGSAVMVAIAGVGFERFFQLLVQETLGSSTGITYLVTLTCVLSLTGLAAAIPIRASMLNVGGEGQLYIGALVAAAVMTTWNSAASLPVVILAGLAGGALFAAIPAVLRFKLKTNEMITTLLLNFIAIYVVLYAVRVPLKSPNSLTPQSIAFPVLFIPLASVGVILASVAILYVTTERMVIGFEIQSVGRNVDAARYAGINTTYIGTITMVIGGACAGLAGSILITSPILNTLVPGFSQLYGYVGVGVALIARLKTLAIPLSAFLISLLFVTAKFLATGTQIPILFASAVVGLIMIVLAFSEKR
jgi:ABC-type uncharacterized transport system permease subunit